MFSCHKSSCPCDFSMHFCCAFGFSEDCVVLSCFVQRLHFKTATFYFLQCFVLPSTFFLYVRAGSFFQVWLRVMLFSGELCKSSFLTSSREYVGQYSLELACV